jgi:peptidoglycan/xylan/chitin deacetylase (PgdA/CDA1 family)
MRLAHDYQLAQMRHMLKNAAFKATYHTGLHGLISRRYAGIGAIWIMHKVVEQKQDSLASYLTITTDFLDRVLTYFKDKVDFVTMDEVRRRLTQPGPIRRPFVSLTFDDGFRDNLELGLPILRRHRVPATVYVASGAPDRELDPWPWRLEKAIFGAYELSLDLPGLPPRLAVARAAEKRAAFEILARYVHRNIPEHCRLAEILLPKSLVSDEALVAEHYLSWENLRQLAADPLITIGGHTVTHPSLRDLDKNDAMTEIVLGRERLEAQLSVAVSHFAYPYGAAANCGVREFDLATRAGFVSAVTVRQGTIFPQHRDHLMCLPRLDLGGKREEISSAILGVAGAAVALGPHWHNPIVTV